MITRIAVAVLLLGGISAHAEAQQVLARETITIRSYDGRTMSAEALRISVPQKRSEPARTLTLAAIRIPSTAQKPGRPIVFLMGGPGIPGTVMAPIPPYFTLFQRLREIGDVVIVDQRGIGQSQPLLDCPQEQPTPADLLHRRESIVDFVRAGVTACAQRMRESGIDPLAFNTIESADDLDDLRQTLGAEHIDLLAFSYGSRLALMYVQRHGDHVGRVVLQGVNGPGLVVKRPAPVGRKLDRMSELLMRDSSWHHNTDLRAAARAARARLAQKPMTLTITDRRTNQPREIVVGRDGFDAIVGVSIDDPRLPALLVSVADNDDRVLELFAEAAWNGLGSANVGLMPRVVNCAADRPAERWQQVRAESATAPFGNYLDNEFLEQDFCATLGYTTQPAEFAGPLPGDVPVLMLTGGLDATNPIENAQEVAARLPNAVSLEVANGVHELLPITAVQEVIADWFRGADIRGRTVVAPRPRFASVEEALAAPPRR